MTAYSHRFGAPTSPQKPTPTVTPHFAWRSYLLRADTMASATWAALYSLSSKLCPRTPKSYGHDAFVIYYKLAQHALLVLDTELYGQKARLYFVRLLLVMHSQGS